MSNCEPSSSRQIRAARLQEQHHTEEVVRDIQKTLLLLASPIAKKDVQCSLTQHRSARIYVRQQS